MKNLTIISLKFFYFYFLFFKKIEIKHLQLYLLYFINN